MLFGDLDQKYFTSLSVCRYESLSTRHLEQIFSFLWQRAARSFPNNKLAVVNNFPGHGLNSLIQNVVFNSYIVEFDGSVGKSMHSNVYNININICSIDVCCLCTYICVRMHTNICAYTHTLSAWKYDIWNYWITTHGLMKITFHSGSLSGTVVSRVRKICRQSDMIIQGLIKSPDRDFLLSSTLVWAPEFSLWHWFSSWPSISKLWPHFLNLKD